MATELEKKDLQKALATLRSAAIEFGKVPIRHKALQWAGAAGRLDHRIERLVNAFESPATQTPAWRVSEPVAGFVARGVAAVEALGATSDIQIDGWEKLGHLLPEGSVDTETLRTRVTERVREMLRTLASDLRASGSTKRSVAGPEGWEIELQYAITDRLPVRPDETSEFLDALLVDATEALAVRRSISGAWGALALDDDGRIELVLKPGWRATPPAPLRDTEFILNPLLDDR